MKKLILIILAFCLSSPVFAEKLRITDTDAMSGVLAKGGALWATARGNDAAGDIYNDIMAIGSYHTTSGTSYLDKRLLIRWDTAASIPSNATITGGVIKMRVTADSSFADFYSVVVAAWDSSTTTHFISGKYNEMYGWHGAATSWGDSMLACSDSLLSGAVAEGDTVIYTLNALGLSKISKTTNTQLYVIDTKDIWNVTPVATTTGYMTYEDVAILEITYTISDNGKGKIYPYVDRRSGQIW